MSDTALAVLSTLGWVGIVGVMLVLFGREEGGAWSIAGGVARGVRDWSSDLQRKPPARASSTPKAEIEEIL